MYAKARRAGRFCLSNGPPPCGKLTCFAYRNISLNSSLRWACNRGLEVVFRRCPMTPRDLMVLLIGVSLWGAVFARGADLISCKRDGDSSILTYGQGVGYKSLKLNRADLCHAGFEFVPDSVSRADGFLILSPEELGRSAKSLVYRVSFKTATAHLIGDLPASAERRHDGVYVDFLQEGGSIYMNTYNLLLDRIDYSSDSLELVIDGDVCTAPDGVVGSLSSGGGRCDRVVPASFQDPVCIAHSGRSARIVDRSLCKELEKVHP